ncbi:MAG: ABC transporter ATP-binding protein [Candidatus Wallbacteria bacterium]|nr:ABC transporter ATP-binding protein [Candidatus Wallbacteria bacterium]
MSMIRVEALSKSFAGRPAVDGLEFEVGPGEIFGYLGPNGAGKTTTQRLLMGLLRPTGGRASIGGFDIVERSLDVRRITGFMPDTPFLYEFMTARQFLGFVAEVHELSPREAVGAVVPLLERFELAGRLDSRLSGYSWGMTKKLTLAALLVARPKVLLLDEPTTGMDPRSVRVMKDLIRDLAQSGSTVLLSTHTLSVAEELCHRVAILRQGRIIAVGTPAELRTRAGAAGRDLESVFLQLTAEESSAAGAPVLAGK